MNDALLADVISAVTQRAGADSNLPVYSVTKHAGFVPSLEYFKKRVFSRDVEGYKIVKPGDFAYATIHLDEGSVGIAPEHGLVSPTYTVFRTDSTKVDPRYLIRFLKSPRALGHYPQLGKGAVHRRKAISLAALGTLPMPLPPLPEQRRIAAILDHADALRAKRRQVLAHLDSLTQAIFRDMFAQGSFELFRAGTLMPRMRNGLSPTTAGTRTAQVLTLSAVTRGAFDPSAVKQGSFAVDPPPDKRIDRQDFLMCRGNGNKALVGIGTYSRVDRPDLVFPDTVIAGTVDTTLVTMPFLGAAWNRWEVRAQIESAARTTNGTYKVNQQTLSQVLVPVPPLTLQVDFTARAARVTHERAAAQDASFAQDELFVSLQSRAFRGEL